MKQPASIQITIPQPCTQDWNEMQPVPGGRHYANKWVIIVTVLLFGLSKSVNGQSINSTGIELQYKSASNTDPAYSNTRDSFEVYGVVKDDKGNPIVNAGVILLSKDTELTSFVRELTDFDGLYRIKIPWAAKEITYELKFSYLGGSLVVSNLHMSKIPLEVNGRLTIPMIKGLRPYGWNGCTRVNYINPEHPGGVRRVTSDMLPNGW